MSKKPIFHGSITALVTPFANGEVDFEALRALVDWQIDERHAWARAGRHDRREPDPDAMKSTAAS